MAVRDIKTSIELGGEKEFEQQLRDISRELRVTDSEMRALKSGFDLTDDGMGNLTRQAQLSKEKLEQQRAVVAGLEREVSVLASSYGEGSREVQAMTIRLNNARDRMNRFEKESEAADRALEEFGRDSTKVGRQIENGIGDAAEDTTRSLKDMVNELRSGVESIRGSAALSVAMDIGGQVIDFVSGVNDFAESTRDYNRQMSFLETNALRYGYEIDYVKDKLWQIVAVTGETDASIEGMSNLLGSGFDTNELELAIAGLLGLFSQFPDTYKFESLAESVRKTLETGVADGQFVDLLEHLGTGVEDFNKAMEESKDVEGDQQVVLSYLRGAYQDAYKEYAEQNQALIEASMSAANLNDAIMTLGETLDTWLTPGRNSFADWLRSVNEFLKGEKSFSDIFDWTPDWTEEEEGAKFNLEERRKQALAEANSLADIENIKRRMRERDFDGPERAVSSGTYNNVKSGFSTELETENQRAEIERMLDEAKRNAENERNMVTYGDKSAPEGSVLAAYYRNLNAAENEALENFKATVAEEKAEFETAGAEAGTSMGLGIVDALAGQAEIAIATAEDMIERINAATAGVNDVVIPVRYGPVTTTMPTGSAGTTEAVVNLDGRKVGTAILPVINNAFGTITNVTGR